MRRRAAMLWAVCLLVVAVWTGGVEALRQHSRIAILAPATPPTPIAPAVVPAPLASSAPTVSLAPLAQLPSDLLGEDRRCEDALRTVAEDAAWKGVGVETREKYLRETCGAARPTACQAYSDVFLLSPHSNGTAGVYAAQAFARLRCDSWPAFSLKQDQVAGCHGGEQVIKHGVKSAEEARRNCLAQIEPECKAYTWSNVTRIHVDSAGKDVLLPANTLAMCSRRLHGHSASPFTQIGHRLRTYLIRPDTSSRCDEATGRVVAGIMTNADARTLCDKARHPPCKGYIWTGPIGIGRNASNAPTPYTVMLCAGFYQYNPISLPDSKYETAVVLSEYMLHPNRKATCSPWAVIGTKWDIRSSLEARLACDRYNGVKGPRCLSYVWNKRAGSVDLCSSVPQTSTLPEAPLFESAWQRPQSCLEISNRWSVAVNKTWGFAPEEVRKLYMAMRCQTSPTPCKQLSDYYGLSPKVDWKQAVRVPGSIRDLWLQQQCRTRPSQVGIDRQKPAYQSVLDTLDSVDARVAEVDDILRRAKLSKSEAGKKAMAEEVKQARLGLEEAIKQIPV